ncbi:SDR family NAD(P)-dependent oxidoreductase [Gammaproteobacteria bacterium]|nr:SDR family NAD(P)-dependent oxidoreductase [Gammaproteobacteria bacterium]MDB2448597.1 SDR family NAD(P)-dependent oxidoreductase [Gammaproteobacteria bacterium]MDB2605074.1 SDR family NAD(P)-dependent oxidoreductase [Gammaproteobacteria bacterium]MDC0348522.1 SDR family NAD(P)-dependent oxidoreductase [Gammaproteobacteria bacterium]
MKIKNSYEKNFLAEKNILITGASKGIGREVAMSLSKYGANVVLLARDENNLDALYDEIVNTHKTSPMIIKCDLNDLDENKAQEIANVLSKNISCLDGLIHNAAILGKMASMIDYDLITWNKVIQTNLTSAYLLTKFLSPMMEQSTNPRIIFTSSGVVKKGRAFWGAYAVSKTAIKSMSEILQDELEPISNIKVFNFDPGATRTSMRAFAYPAEDPRSLKDTSSLIDYYLWMLSDFSNHTNNRYIEFNQN